MDNYTKEDFVNSAETLCAKALKLNTFNGYEALIASLTRMRGRINEQIDGIEECQG